MIAAIDPGSEKTGVAVLGGDGSLAEKKIIPTGDLEAYLTGAYAQYRFTHIVMGDGTNHVVLAARRRGVDTAAGSCRDLFSRRREKYDCRRPGYVFQVYAPPGMAALRAAVAAVSARTGRRFRGLDHWSPLHS